MSEPKFTEFKWEDCPAWGVRFEHEKNNIFFGRNLLIEIPRKEAIYLAKELNRIIEIIR